MSSETPSKALFLEDLIDSLNHWDLGKINSIKVIILEVFILKKNAENNLSFFSVLHPLPKPKLCKYTCTYVDVKVTF